MAKQTFTTGQVLTAAQVNSLQANDFNQTVSAKTASYVLVASDKGTRIEFNTSGSVTCTVNTGLFDAGDTVYIQNRGAGVVTITAGTATVNTSASLAVNQWEGGLLYFISASAAIWYEYASTANGDITGVTAGTGISGGGTSGDVTITNTMATAIDAKGDLVAGTADNTFARLAVGSNGETLVADSSTSTGLRYNPPVGSLANPIINGGFDIWQRGTSGFVPGNNSTTFAADRWLIQRGTTGSTVSRQTISDSTNLPNIQYALRVARDSGNTSTSTIGLATNVETTNSIPFANRTVTLSFYARAGANYSATSSALNAELRTGTGTDENTFSTYTGSATPISSNVTLTTTWQRFALTGTLAATTTEFALKFVFTPVGTAGANDWYEISGVQVDVGTWSASTAPAFRRSGNTLAGELAACQRYYSKSAQTATAPADGLGYSTNCVYQMNVTNSTSVLVTSAFFFPVNMRTAPTMTFYRSDLSATNGKWGYYSGSWNAGTTTVTAMLTDKAFAVEMGGTYTANNAYTIAGGWAASAEL